MSLIEARRVQRGWTRAELARRTRMDASDIGRIERGQMRPYPGQARKIAAALGIQPEAIAGQRTDDIRS